MNTEIQSMPPISLFVYEEVLVSELFDVSVLFALVIVRKDKRDDTVVSLEDYKKALGPLALQLTEEEMLKAFILSDRLAGVLFDMWRAADKSAVK